MMPQAEQYPFVAKDPTAGPIGLVPYLPIQLTLGSQTVSVMGLLDTAAAVSVLPYDVGQQLGAIWENQTTVLELTGNLAQQEARAFLVQLWERSRLFGWPLPGLKAVRFPSCLDRSISSWSSTCVSFALKRSSR